MSRLTTAIEAALAAGDVLRRKYHQARTVRSKGLRDLVTDADVAAQGAILARLRAAHPTDASLSEEGQNETDLASLTPTWLIDPLDGTNNYARQVPMFGVSIGLVVGGLLQLGVVLDPLRRELYYAERGQGAFLQTGRGRPRRLTVSSVVEVGRAMLAIGWPRDDRLRARAAELTPRLGAACHSLRATGSAALALAYIAAGRLDGSFFLRLQPWDVAAGAALILEAGGQISALDGGPWQLESPQLVASNGHLHAEMTRRLAVA
jgi:myo-inositol-1(or 4)-monophosphatase